MGFLSGQLKKAAKDLEIENLKAQLEGSESKFREVHSKAVRTLQEKANIEQHLESIRKQLTYHQVRGEKLADIISNLEVVNERLRATIAKLEAEKAAKEIAIMIEVELSC